MPIPRIIKRLAKWIPGVVLLDDFLCKRYTGLGRRDPNHRGNYGSPLPDIAEVDTYADRLFRRDVEELPGINLRTQSQLELLKELSQYHPEFCWSATRADGLRYTTDNHWFEEGDAFVLYAMLRHFRPQRVIEIGSGYSSALMLDTNARFLAGNTQLTFIEPRPERLKSLLHPNDCRIELIESNVQSVPLEQLTCLSPGDFLFIDSSHVCRTGGDVNHLFFNVIPNLRAGCFIHLHDIFWPFEYPEEWIRLGYAWNEIYFVRALLYSSTALEIVFFVDYLDTIHQSTVAALAPRMLKGRHGSLWLRKL
jgi:predicted O-methyltransferase YrrM